MPSVLSLHITPDCSLPKRCPFCYELAAKHSKAKPLQWFMDIPTIARDIGVEQAPLGGGEATLNPKQLLCLAAKFRDNDIIPNLTTNGMNRIKCNNLFGIISFSFDKYKISKIGLRNLVKNIKYYKRTNKETKIGLNYLLLDKDSLYHLPKAIGFFNDIIDNFYVLHLKNNPVDYSSNDIKYVLYPLAAIMKDRIFVDDSIQLLLKRKEYCHFGSEMMTIDFDGAIRGCSFAEPFGYLDKVSDLKDLAAKYPLQRCYKCPYTKNV